MPIATKSGHLFEELLRSYPGDPAARQRALSLARTPGGGIGRHRFEPGHFTASAFVLSPARDAVLLIHHRKLRRWLQPGGHIEDKDPSPLEAARREAAEEVEGLGALQPLSNSLFDLDIHPIPALGAEPAHEHFDLRFAFVAEFDTVGAGAEVQDARWVDLGHLEGVESDDSVRRAVGLLRQRFS